MGQLQVPSLASIFIAFLSSRSCKALLISHLKNPCKFHASKSLAQVKVVADFFFISKMTTGILAVGVSVK